MANFKRVKAGDRVAADDYNAIAEALERFANLKVADGSNLRLWDFPEGEHLAYHPPVETLALLSESTSPYSFVEVDEASGGTFAARTVGDSCSSCAYEVNGKSGLGGTVQRIVWTQAGDWRFQAMRGLGLCNPASTTATFNVKGCAALALPGTTVSLTGPDSISGTTDASGTYVAGIITPGAYNYTIINHKYQTFTGTLSVPTCGTAVTVNATLTIDTTNYICCGQHHFPKNLTLTCSAGTFALTFGTSGWSTQIIDISTIVWGWKPDGTGGWTPDCAPGGASHSGITRVQFFLNAVGPCNKCSEIGEVGPCSVAFVCQPMEQSPAGSGIGEISQQVVTPADLPLTFNFPSTDSFGLCVQGVIPISGTVVISE